MKEHEFGSATERIAVVVAEMILGRPMSTRRVSELTGVQQSGAYKMLDKIATVLPVEVERDQGGTQVWRYLNQ